MGIFRRSAAVESVIRPEDIAARQEKVREEGRQVFLHMQTLTVNDVAPLVTDVEAKIRQQYHDQGHVTKVEVRVPDNIAGPIWWCGAFRDETERMIKRSVPEAAAFDYFGNTESGHFVRVTLKESIHEPAVRPFQRRIA